MVETQFAELEQNRPGGRAGGFYTSTLHPPPQASMVEIAEAIVVAAAELKATGISWAPERIPVHRSLIPRDHSFRDGSAGRPPSKRSSPSVRSNHDRTGRPPPQPYGSRVPLNHLAGKRFRCGGRHSLWRTPSISLANTLRGSSALPV